MQKIILLLLVVACSKISIGQCGKKAIIVSSQTEYLDGNNTLQRTVEEKSVIDISKTELIITPGDQPKMSGTINSDSCDWKVPYKEGKSVIKVTFTREGGEVRNATVTIEGKDGKISLLFEMAEMPHKKIRLVADKFEEKI